MHTATNYYLFSLAISDLLLLLSGLPPEMYSLWSKYPYVFGEPFCIISGLASETSSNATVLTITAFTVERYVAICHPFLTHTFCKSSRAVKFIIAIWLIALSCAVPQAAQLGLVYAVDDRQEKVSEEYKICGMKNRYPYLFEASTVIFFFAPMSVITILYILIGMKLHRSTSQKSSQRLRDSRKGTGYGTTRVVKMLVVVVVAFFICWAPFQAQRLFAVYVGATSPLMILLYKAITYMSGLLYYLSTTINPFLYNIMSLKFREAFKSTLTRCLSRDMRCEAANGSSGGPIAPRFNYSVLSHRSARNSNNSNNNNNSLSSGNSYIDQVDLHRRPLVVSFKRKNATVSLDYICSNQRDYLHVPNTRRCYYSPPIIKQKPPQQSAPVPSPERRKPADGRPKILRIEDIEIFQESRFKIERKRRRKRDEEAKSCSVEDKNLPADGVVETAPGVKKSHTAPCLVAD